jgi:uncharacterized protein
VPVCSLRVLVLAGAVLAALSVAASAEAAFARGTVELRKQGGGTVRLSVELARTPDERAQGLMYRRSLPPRHGMLFVFPTRVHGGFWMKNTLIPLSIAFIGTDGRIQQIMVMEPCRRDPCRVYRPARPYVRALEVNKGAFGRWGVRRGDRVVLLRR